MRGVADSLMEFAMPLCYNLNVMKTKQIQTIPAIFRRVLAAALALAAFALLAPAAQAEDGVFALGESSDDVHRVEIRLSDLGYFKGVVNGRWDPADADAFAAFSTANGVSQSGAAELLFSNDAIAASRHGGTVFVGGTQGFLLTYGTLMPWEEVSAKLVPGQSYNVTSCYTAITLHMVCVSVGAHARMRPELDWDDATLRGFFGSTSSSEKHPIVVTIDGVLVAASIQQAAPDMSGEAQPEYGVYFHDSLSNVGGIPDAEHEAIVQIAANME